MLLSEFFIFLSETYYIYKAYTVKPYCNAAYYAAGFTPIGDGLQGGVVHYLEVFGVEYRQAF